MFGAEPAFQECISPSPGWIWVAFAASSQHCCGWEDLQSQGPRVRTHPEPPAHLHSREELDPAWQEPKLALAQLDTFQQ